MERHYKRIAAALPMEERLAQLAEECAELSQAALKLRRALSGVNPTPKTAEACWDELLEEIGDVFVCIDVIAIEFGAARTARDIEATMREKAERWAGRIEADPPRMG